MVALKEQIITGITHPHVNSMYLKRRPDHEEDSTLVIETFDYHTDMEMDGRDDYIMDLLLDLEVLKRQVEQKVGKISRIDIRCH